MSLDQRIIQITHQALAGCTPRQQAAYRLVEGLDEQGNPTTPVPVGEAATRLNSDRGNLIHSLNAARVEVLTSICAHLYEHAKEQERGEEEGVTLLEAIGQSTVDEDELSTRYIVSRHQRSTTIRLGAGSEAMTLAAKRHSAQERRSATIDAHIRYSDGRPA